MKFNIKKEYTEEVELELPVCFVEELTYFKTVYLLTNADNNKFDGIVLDFRRKDKKEDWEFFSLRKGFIFEDKIQKLINGEYKAQKLNYFKLAMKEVAKGMENIAEDLTQILK